MSDTAASRDEVEFVPYTMTEKAHNSIKAAIASLARAFDDIGPRVLEIPIAESQPVATPRKQHRNYGGRSTRSANANSTLPKQSQQPHILFQNAWKAGDEAKSLGLKGAELTKAAQLQWKNLPPANKAVWKEKSAALAAESAVGPSAKSAESEQNKMEHDNAMTTGQNLNDGDNKLEQRDIRACGDISEKIESLVSSIATLVSDKGQAKEVEPASASISPASSSTSSVSTNDVDQSPILPPTVLPPTVLPPTVLPSLAIPLETPTTSATSTFSKKRASPELGPNTGPKKKSPKHSEIPLVPTAPNVQGSKIKSNEPSEAAPVKPAKPSENPAIKASKPAAGTGSKKFVPPTLKKSVAAVPAEKVAIPAVKMALLHPTTLDQKQGSVSESAVDENEPVPIAVAAEETAARPMFVSAGKNPKSEAIIDIVEDPGFRLTMGPRGADSAPHNNEAEALAEGGEEEVSGSSAGELGAEAKGIVDDSPVVIVDVLKAGVSAGDEGKILFAKPAFVSASKKKHVVEDSDDDMAPAALVLEVQAEGDEMSEGIAVE